MLQRNFYHAWKRQNKTKPTLQGIEKHRGQQRPRRAGQVDVLSDIQGANSSLRGISRDVQLRERKKGEKDFKLKPNQKKSASDHIRIPFLEITPNWGQLFFCYTQLWALNSGFTPGMVWDHMWCQIQPRLSPCKQAPYPLSYCSGPFSCGRTGHRKRTGYGGSHCSHQPTWSLSTELGCSPPFSTTRCGSGWGSKLDPRGDAGEANPEIEEFLPGTIHQQHSTQHHYGLRLPLPRNNPKLTLGRHED